MITIHPRKPTLVCSSLWFKSFYFRGSSPFLVVYLKCFMNMGHENMSGCRPVSCYIHPTSFIVHIYQQPNFWTFCSVDKRFAQQKTGKLHNIIMHNIIWTYRYTEYRVYYWPRTHAMFDVTLLSRICWSIRLHSFVDTLISTSDFFNP